MKQIAAVFVLVGLASHIPVSSHAEEPWIEPTIVEAIAKDAQRLAARRAATSRLTTALDALQAAEKAEKAEKLEQDVKNAIAAGADVNAPGNQGRALNRYARLHDEAMVYLLLKNKADPNLVFEGSTPLSEAIYWPQDAAGALRELRVVHRLLDAGADPSEVAFAGEYTFGALQVAVVRNAPVIVVEELLVRGAALDRDIFLSALLNFRARAKLPSPQAQDNAVAILDLLLRDPRLPADLFGLVNNTR